MVAAAGENVGLKPRTAMICLLALLLGLGVSVYLALRNSALEQVGPRHEPFVDFLLERKPSICVNMEPLVDLYDGKQLIDYLAIRYHRKRGYLEGFLPRLEELRSQGRIEILETRRFFFGSLFHEGYSYVAWRPL